MGRWRASGCSQRWVYFAERGGRIKIGTSVQVDLRMRALGAALLAVTPGGFDVERAMHQRFDEHALGHEWFVDSPELRRFIAALPSPEEPPASERPRPGQRQVYIPDEVAALLGVSRQEADRRAVAGTLGAPTLWVTHRRAPSGWRVYMPALDAYLATGETVRASA